ncbi:phage tail assembly chaperone G [Bacillus infantis]|uniref:Phage tail assembly protein n=1 Tax=Bacillus infantis TaxID=324767 RepID=A0A5D4RJQ4_9BACI|nr:hypothetical protein [Bacillus infantis]TYS50086.1 hypothetical protein FZD51_05900 [Bacillus infantis]
MRIELTKDGENKVFTAPFIPSRAFRKMLGLKKELTNFDNLTPEQLDEVMGIIVNDIFQDKFTLDDLYDGLPADQLIPTIYKIIESVSGGPGAAGNEVKA